MGAYSSGAYFAEMIFRWEGEGGSLFEWGLSGGGGLFQDLRLL